LQTQSLKLPQVCDNTPVLMKVIFAMHNEKPPVALGKYLIVSVVAILLDQLTKWLVIKNIPAPVYDAQGYFLGATRINVIPNFFDLTHVYNPGAAFSFLANAGGWQVVFFSALAFIISGWLLWSIRKAQFACWGNWGAAAIVGGALGNVVDRFVHGHVIDFLLFYVEPHYYPAFNIADSFICVGAVMLVIDGFAQAKKDKQNKQVSV